MNIIADKIQDPERRLIARLFFNSFYVFFLSTLTAALGSIIDGILIGNTMDTTAVAAFGLVIPLNFSFSFLGGILSSGAQNLCTRKIAQGDIKKSRELFSVAFLTGLTLSVVVMFAVSLLSVPLITWLGSDSLPPDLFQEARHYLLGYAIGLPAITCMRILTAFMSLDSDRMRAFYSVVLMSAVNLIGDFLCISVFHSGLAGIAAVTSLSYYVGFADLLGHFRKHGIMLGITLKNLKWGDLWSVVKRGIPRGMLETAVLLHGIYINRILADISESALAGYSVQISLSFLTDAVIIGVAQAILVQGAMFFGEENREALGKLMRIAIQYEVTLVPVISLLCYLLAPFIAKLYLGTNFDAYALGINSVRWYAAALLFQGTNMLYAYYLQASGNLLYANLIYIVEWLVYTISIVNGFPHGSGSQVYRGISLAHVLTFVTIVIYLMVKNRHLRITMEDILALPKGFGFAKGDEVTAEIDSTKVNEANAKQIVVQVSEMVRSFARKKGIDERRANAASLAVEEMTSGIILKAFPETPGPNVLTVRAFTKNNELILLLRDDCDPFDPRKGLKMIKSDDPVANIGIRLTMGMAKDVSYTSAQRLNNLIIRI